MIKRDLASAPKPQGTAKPKTLGVVIVVLTGFGLVALAYGLAWLYAATLGGGL